jgi:single-strand DNA-binding protein
MASFAKTIIAGNLGRDPETRYLPAGDAVCNFSVAVTESWKDRNSGEKKESTTWYRVNAFGKLAEICAQYLKKGSQVLIEGKMQCREWEKDGVKQYSWELRAESMQMFGGKPDSSQEKAGGIYGRSGPDRKPAQSSQGEKVPPFYDDMDDGEIPF